MSISDKTLHQTIAACVQKLLPVVKNSIPCSHQTQSKIAMRVYCHLPAKNNISFDIHKKIHK